MWASNESVCKSLVRTAIVSLNFLENVPFLIDIPHHDNTKPSKVPGEGGDFGDGVQVEDGREGHVVMMDDVPMPSLNSSDRTCQEYFICSSDYEQVQLGVCMFLPYYDGHTHSKNIHKQKK